MTDIGNTVAEFAGWAAALEIFGVPRWVSVPIGAFVVWWLVVKGNYKTVEKIFLIACTVYLTYIVSAFVRQARLGGRHPADDRAPDRVERRLDPDDHRHRRDDDRPLDAVLPAVVDRREADRRRRSTGSPAGTSSSAAS